MLVPFRKTAIIVDQLAFRRARIESFLEPWAEAENVELVSLQPESAHTRLIESGGHILIYTVGGTHPSPNESLAEINLLHTLCPTAPLVILSDDTSTVNGSVALNSGAHGYLSDSMPPELVLRALSFILNGGMYFPPAAILSSQTKTETSAELPRSTFENEQPGRLVHPQQRTMFAASNVNTLQPPPHLFGEAMQDSQQASALSIIECDSSQLSSGGAQLTDRQKGILRCICRGYSNKIIARTFDITESTVKIHVKVILRKIGVKNRTQAAIWAIQNGLCKASDGSDVLSKTYVA
jgi:DNA-binding NarL/FixJ family response regulator